MKANEIEVGEKYRAKVSGRLVTVRVDAIREVNSYAGRDAYSGQPKYRDHKMYDVTNLTTGRRTTFRSAAKFRCTEREITRHVVSQLDARLRANYDSNRRGSLTPEAAGEEFNAIITEEKARRKADNDHIGTRPNESPNPELELRQVSPKLNTEAV